MGSVKNGVVEILFERLNRVSVVRGALDHILFLTLEFAIIAIIGSENFGPEFELLPKY